MHSDLILFELPKPCNSRDYTLNKEDTMLRTDSRWTLQVKKASYKEIHLPLGVVGRGVSTKRSTFLPNSEGAQCVRQRAGSLCKEETPITIDWAHRRDAVEAGQRTYSSRGVD